MENQDIVHHYSPLDPEYGDEEQRTTSGFLSKHVTSLFNFLVWKRSWVYGVMAVSLGTLFFLGVTYYFESIFSEPQYTTDNLLNFVDTPLSTLTNIKSSPFRGAFEEFIQQYDRQYVSIKEKALRFKIFVENYLKILKHNQEGHSYTLKLNNFADLTPTEFKQNYLTYRPYRRIKDMQNILRSREPIKIKELFNEKASEETETKIETKILLPSDSQEGATDNDWFSSKNSPHTNKLDEQPVESAAPLRLHDDYIASFAYSTPTELPTYVNWYIHGCVSEVKNQGNCGSCWAFSATGAVEGAYCIKYSKKISLSEQQLIDCATKEGNLGCKGGDVDYAFIYMIRKQNLCFESEYPYDAASHKCHDTICRHRAYDPFVYADPPDTDSGFIMPFPASESSRSLEGDGKREEKDADDSDIFKKETDGPLTPPSEQTEPNFNVRVIGYVDVPALKEQALMAAVAFRGPVSVGVESDDWQFYHSGIYNAPCGHNLDHAVLVVGYGTENNTDYWIIKNSWGTTWGKEGYMKLVRNHRTYGECGILLAGTYPVIE